MPAPTIAFVTPPPSTLTMVPVPLAGWEIRGAIAVATNDDWLINCSIAKINAPSIDPADSTATFSASARVPANEADMANAIAKLQVLVDAVYDHFVPLPSP